MTYFIYGIISIPALALLILIVRSCIAGALAAGRGAGGSIQTFVISHRWLIASAIAIPGAYFMLTGGSAQTLVLIVALIVGIFAMNILMQSPPSSWTSLALIAVVLLFISWGPTWRYAEQVKEWWAGEATATTVEELEGRIPTIVGNQLNITPGEWTTVMTDHVVFADSVGCYFPEYMPREAFILSYPEDVSRYYFTPEEDGLQRLKVRFVRDISPDRPEGC